MQRHKNINIFTVYRHKELKYRGTKKSWIMLENTKKILQIQTVEQWHRKKWNVLTLIMNNSEDDFDL